eukprot:1085171-Pelagomonas_calceolata.AAC.1
MDGKFTGRGTDSLDPTRGFCKQQGGVARAHVTSMLTSHTHTHLAEHQHAMVAHLGTPEGTCCPMAHLCAALLQHRVEVRVGILAILLCAHCSALTSPDVCPNSRTPSL